MADRWEQYELDFLHEVYADMPIPVIAEKLERTYAAIAMKAQMYGLRKSTTYMRESARNAREARAMNRAQPAGLVAGVRRMA